MPQSLEAVRNLPEVRNKSREIGTSGQAFTIFLYALITECLVGRFPSCQRKGVWRSLLNHSSSAIQHNGGIVFYMVLFFWHFHLVLLYC